MELGRRRKPFVAHISADGEITQVKLDYRKKVKVINVRRKTAKRSEQRSNRNLSLSPVRFEDAIAAALETPPERKPNKKAKVATPKK